MSFRSLLGTKLSDETSNPRMTSTERSRKYRRKLKDNAEKLLEMRKKDREHKKRQRAEKKRKPEGKRTTGIT